MFALDAKRMGYSRRHARSARAFAVRASRRRTDRRRVRRSRGDRRARAAQRRRHLRVRKHRHRVGACISKRSGIASRRRAACCTSRKTGCCEKQFARESGLATTEFARVQQRRRSRRSAARANRLSGDPQDGSRRIRRQGSMARDSLEQARAALASAARRGADLRAAGCRSRAS